MRNTLLVLTVLAVVAFAANPFGPSYRGAVAPAAKPGAYLVSFWGSPKFDPGRDAPPLAPELQVDDFPGDGTGYYLVQFHGSATSDQVRELKSLGSRYVGFHSRFIGFAKLDREQAEAARRLGFVRSVVPYHPGLKFGDWCLAEQGYGQLTVTLFYDEDLEQAVRDLAAIGCEVEDTEVTELFKGVRVSCDRETVADISRLPYVLSVQEWYPCEPENDDCQWVVQTWAQNERRVWDQGLLGDDEILGFLDTGLDADHWAFKDPSVPITDTGEFPTHRKVVAFKHYPPASGVGDPSGHGTHCAGTIAGEDSINGGSSTYDGHSKGARIVHLSPIPGSSVQDYNPHFNTMTNWLNNPELRPHTISNSWWNLTRGQYTNSAVSVDQFSWDNRDVVILKSCGNQGQSQRKVITDPGNSKSIIACGALENGTNSDQLASFSSRGPASDERIKPDICVPGEDIYSARRNTSNSYTQMSGTSMAAPAVNGCVGLLRSYLRKGYYPSGQANPADTFGYVSAALLKAMVIISADPNVESYVVPSEYIGWGRLNLDSVMYFNDSIPDTRKLLLYDDTTGLATGEYVEYTFQVDDTMPLRAGVVWTDTAAAAGANPCLINDLDVLLTAPGGTYYKGNLYQGGHSEPDPSGPHDALNPLEMFRVEQPETGTWTLRVTGTAVPVGDSQPYAVVVTGGVSAGSMHDVGVMTIVVPPDTVDSGVVITPTALVRNFGTEPETFPVYFTVSLCFSDSAIVSIPAGTTDTVEFGDWTPESVGSHEILCWTALPGDEDPGNDQVTDTVMVIPPTGIAEQGRLPTAVLLDRGRPTPFRGNVSIRFGIPRAARVELAVYNAAGVMVRQLASGDRPAGYHRVAWDGRDDAGRQVSRGIFYARLATGDSREMRKLVKLD